MKKRAFTLLLVLALLTACIPLSASALTASMYVYTSNGKSLNMRSYPSMDADIVTTLPYGAIVDVYSGWDETWAHCSYNGVDGYCKTRYLTASVPGVRPSPTSSPVSAGLYDNFETCDFYATVRPSNPGGFVHMRWAPSKNQPIHSDYYYGSTLHVIADNGTWCQVIDESGNVAGFMMKAFLSFQY
ncbi:MAG: SH3 domain-containing protein [Eubacteriales bacterium]|nr:SH3 domain-containing protein [Eubacteriales bacterium]